MFYHSRELDVLAQNKCDEGYRDAIKKMAYKSVDTNVPDRIAKSMKMVEEVETITLVYVTQCLLIFKKTLVEVQELIENAHSKIQMVPDKVLMKMASLRLNSFMRSIKKTRSNVDEIRSISKFVEEREKFIKTHGYYQLEGIVRNFNEFTLKTGLEDEHISQGWDLYIVSQKPKKYTILPDGTKEWKLKGERHRKNGPAVERADGTKFWYLNGKLHREDGPAIERPDGTRGWYLNGGLHREDGPAIERAGGRKEWYLKGRKLKVRSLKGLEKQIKIMIVQEISKS